MCNTRRHMNRECPDQRSLINIMLTHPCYTSPPPPPPPLPPSPGYTICSFKACIDIKKKNSKGIFRIKPNYFILFFFFFFCQRFALHEFLLVEAITIVSHKKRYIFRGRQLSNCFVSLLKWVYTKNE